MQGFIPQQNVQYQVVGQVGIIDQCSKLSNSEIVTYVHQFLDFSVLLDISFILFIYFHFVILFIYFPLFKFW